MNISDSHQYLRDKDIESFEVFVSSKDYLNDLRLLAGRAILDLGLKPILTDEAHYGVATTSNTEYLDKARSSDILVVILEENPSKKIVNEEEYYQFVRQEIEVNFEVGKKPLLFVQESADKKKSSQAQKLIKEVEKKCFKSTFKNFLEFEDGLKKSLLVHLIRSTKPSTKLLKNKDAFYNHATDIVKKNPQFFFLCQKTPFIVLGPRKGDRGEKIFYEATIEWLKGMNDDSKECVWVFEEKTTLRELKNLKNFYDIKTIKKNIKLINQLLDSDNYFHLIPSDKEIHQVALFDHNYIAWFMIKGDVFGFSDETPSISMELKIIAKKYHQNYNKTNQAIKTLLKKYEKAL